jgi:ABC-type spermidine/putrescine transport system permease subunit I
MALTEGSSLDIPACAGSSSIPYFWLLLFFLAPFIIVFKISLSQKAIAMPPYTPVLDFVDGLGRFIDAVREFSLRQLSS